MIWLYNYLELVIVFSIYLSVAQKMATNVLVWCVCSRASCCFYVLMSVHRLFMELSGHCAVFGLGLSEILAHPTSCWPLSVLWLSWRSDNLSCSEKHSQQKGIANTCSQEKIEHFLDYMTMHSNATICCDLSEMMLNIHSYASYLTAPYS